MIGVEKRVFVYNDATKVHMHACVNAIRSTCSLVCISYACIQEIIYCIRRMAGWQITAICGIEFCDTNVYIFCTMNARWQLVGRFRNIVFVEL